MGSDIGLYYPFIEFRDDAWMKLAALYWDKIGRIVLPEYKTRDSDTVQRLIGELDFIPSFQPSSEEINTVGSKFLTLLERHEQELVGQYGYGTSPLGRLVGMQQMWPSSEDIRTLWSSHHSFSSPPLPAYIFFSGRVSMELVRAFMRSKLVFFVEGSEKTPLLGIHPKLAFIYMEALAEEMAVARHFHPVTDGMLEHVAISGCTLERLAYALLNDKEEGKEVVLADPTLTEHEIEVLMATISLRSVLPRNLSEVPIAKIIAFRKRYSQELVAFQAYLQEFVAQVSMLQDMKDPMALQVHLTVEYEKNLKSQMDDLKKCLRSLGIDTVSGAMNIRVALPTLITSAGVYLGQAHIGPINPILVGTGALAFSLLPVIRDRGKEAQEKMRSSPAAYLLHVEEGLEPTKLTSLIAQNARKLFFNV